jgi:hypothetical protein
MMLAGGGWRVFELLIKGTKILYEKICQEVPWKRLFEKS